MRHKNINILQEYNHELAKVKREHKDIPLWTQRKIAAAHVKMPRNKRD